MKYEVTIKEIEIYVVDIEADNDDEAREKAYDLLDGKSQKEKYEYHYDSDSECEAFES